MENKEETDLPNMIGNPVKAFVSSLFEGVQEGLKERNMKMCKEGEAEAKMELNAIATENGGAKILGSGGELERIKSTITSQKITVFVRRKL